MFDERQDEKLVWVELDLDTTSHDVQTHGLMIPICLRSNMALER